MTQSEALNTLQTLRRLPAETEVVEFKEAKNTFDFTRLGKYFSALSNEANLKQKSCAWLIFGIRDTDHAVVGSQFRSNLTDLHHLKAEIAEKTTNRITFIEIYALDLSEGRVVLFQIPPAPRGLPVAWEGHYYGRDHDQLGPLNLEELERIRAQAVIDDWSAALCAGAGLDDLSPDAIVQARANYQKKFPHLADDIAAWDDVTFLNKAKVAIQGKLTRTAIILLGRAEAEHFLLPAQAQMTWILKDKDGIELDYAHFGPPFLLRVNELYQKIRNLRYRYIKDETLFPDEVDMYEPYVIREALHNCIAHQDYTLAGRINVVEYPDHLIFTNVGDFLPGSVEQVIQQDAPPERYRNPFLTQAMMNLNMIDTIGSGIKRMFRIQQARLFPLPDFDLREHRVKMTLIGKVLDLDYARTLSRHPDLSLSEIILLDKLQKGLLLSDDDIKHLRRKQLIEGRSPNVYISSRLAETTGQKEDYIKTRRFKDQHYKALIRDYLKEYGSASKPDIDNLLFDILPDVLNPVQKRNKIRNILYAMSKREQTIHNEGTHRNPIWTLAGEDRVLDKH